MMILNELLDLERQGVSVAQEDDTVVIRVHQNALEAVLQLDEFEQNVLDIKSLSRPFQALTGSLREFLQQLNAESFVGLLQSIKPAQPCVLCGSIFPQGNVCIDEDMEAVQDDALRHFGVSSAGELQKAFPRNKQLFWQPRSHQVRYQQRVVQYRMYKGTREESFFVETLVPAGDARPLEMLELCDCVEQGAAGPYYWHGTCADWLGLQ